MENIKDEQLKKEMVFHLYGRFAPIRDIINKNRDSGENFRILDVGGRGNWMKKFFPDDEVFYLDPFLDSDDKNFIKGDGCDMPLKNESFDWVVSTDVFEHIPNEKRKAFFEENLRVSKKGVILVAPFFSKEVEQAEINANENFKSLHNGADHIWLREHIENGLPSMSDFENLLKEKNISFQKLYNNGLFLWQVLIGLEFLTDENLNDDTKNELEKFNYFYNTEVFPFDNNEPSYRKIYFIKKDTNLKNILVENKEISDLLFLNTIRRAIDLTVKIEVINKKLIQEKEQTIQSKEQLIQEKEQEKVNLNQTVESKNQEIQEKEQTIQSKEQEMVNLNQTIQSKEQEINALRNSTSWKITKPIRFIKNKILRIKNLILSLLRLSKKAWIILKRDGLRIFFKKVIIYIIYKKFKLKLNKIKKFTKKEVAFISGCPGDSMRYRCYNQQEQLKKHNIDSDVFEFSEIDISKIFNLYNIFIFHRVPITKEIKEFIELGKKNNKIFIFDTDDLIFSEKYGKHIRILNNMKKDEIDLYYSGLKRYSETLKLCQYSIGSTEKIKNELKAYHENVFVNQNGISDELISISKDALCNIKKDHNIIIGYMSGTKTHDVDFKEAQEALLYILENYKNCRLLIAGHLTLDTKFDKHKNKIIRNSHMSWKKLPYEIVKLDINIAPLEMNNPFCESKSDLKYFEAALVKVPTIASNTGAFNFNITDGINGFLAKNNNEWTSKLELLVKDAELRKIIGNNAYNDVLKNRNSFISGENITQILENIKKIHKNNNY